MNFKRSENKPRILSNQNPKLVKKAQFSPDGSGGLAGSATAYAMPKFYSPIHTPSSWEIPWRRRDVMTWAFSENSLLPSENFTFKSPVDFYNESQCRRVIEDKLTEGHILQYIRNGRLIGGFGEVRKPLHMSRRRAENKRFIEFGSDTCPWKCDVSEEHRLYIVKADDADRAAPVSDEETFFRLPYKAKIHKVRAENVNFGDFMLTPLPTNTTGAGNLDDIADAAQNFIFADDTSDYIGDFIFDDAIVNMNKACTIELLDLIFSHEPMLRDGWMVYKLGGPYGAYGYSEEVLQQLYMLCIKAGVEPRYSQATKTRNAEFKILARDIIPAFARCRKYLAEQEFKPAEQRETTNFFTSINGICYFAQQVLHRREHLYTGFCYDFQVNPDKSHLCGPFVVSNCRFFAANEPKVAAALNFYSQYPVKDFENVCEDVAIKKFFDDVKRKLRLRHVLKMAAYEYFCIGDVFIFADIACPCCHGSGFVKNLRTNETMPCNHPGGTISSLTILNPDWVEVVASYMAQSEEIITIMPDENIRKIVASRTPKELYDRIPPMMRQAVLSGKPILLHPDCITHLAHDRVPYEAYGRSMLMRLFKTLAYKDKITQAQWTVADRHILPMRLVKVGNDNNTATEHHIQDIRGQILQTANDPNFVLVTHHAVSIEYIGAQGSILQLGKEYDVIKEEILDGLMINEGLLHGDSSSYSSASIGIEVMIDRLTSFQEELAEFIEERIYRPIAIMQGFMAKDENGKPTKPIYPTIKWQEMKLRDDSQMKNLVTQLADKKILSNQTLLEYFGFNYDVEIERLRMENIINAEIGVSNDENGGDGMGGGDIGGFGGFGGGGGGDFGGDMGGGDMGGGMGGDINLDNEPAFDGGGGAAPGGAPAGGEASRRFRAPEVSLKNRPKKPIEKVIPQKPGDKPIIAPANYLLNKPEQKLYNALHKAGVKVIPQYKPMHGRKFLLDFALPQLKIGIECDGGIFHHSEERQKRDMIRDRTLGQQGWYIHRFSESDINDRLNTVVLPKISEIIRERTRKNSRK